MVNSVNSAVVTVVMGPALPHKALHTQHLALIESPIDLRCRCKLQPYRTAMKPTCHWGILSGCHECRLPFALLWSVACFHQ